MCAVSRMFIFTLRLQYICDVIKQNQSEVGNIDFKIEPNKAENVFCFLLFSTAHISGTNWPISMGFSAKCSCKKDAYS